MKEEELIENGVRMTEHEGRNFFYVADIKKNLPDMKVNVDQIIELDGIVLIEAKHIEPMTEFDKNIRRSMMYKPRK